jgi:hypothetical protein
MIYTIVNGIKISYNNQGKIHSFGDIPAVVRENGYKELR